MYSAFCYYLDRKQIIIIILLAIGSFLRPAFFLRDIFLYLLYVVKALHR